MPSRIAPIFFPTADDDDIHHVDNESSLSSFSFGCFSRNHLFLLSLSLVLSSAVEIVMMHLLSYRAIPSLLN